MDHQTASDKKNVEVIVPFYKGRQYCERLIQSLENQTTDFSFSYRFLVTGSGDGTEEYLKERGIRFESVAVFNHAKTREEAIMASPADIVVLLTQDVLLTQKDAIQTVVDSINGDVKLAYLRQVCRNWSIERYTRSVNYAKTSAIKTFEDIKKMGLNAFFCSDACAAYDVAFFKTIGGYDGKMLPTNEDMYYARKVLLSKKCVCYCAESYVVHTHYFSLRQTYERYKLVGQFFAENPVFSEYSAGHAGLKLAVQVLTRILLTFNLYALFSFLPNMIARYLGKKAGEKSVREQNG